MARVGHKLTWKERYLLGDLHEIVREWHVLVVENLGKQTFVLAGNELVGREIGSVRINGMSLNNTVNIFVTVVNELVG